MLVKLAVRPDRGVILAACGLAAGILLPLVGTLILAGLAPTVPGPWIAYAPPGTPLHLSEAPVPDWVLAASADGTRFAYRVGDPGVLPGQQRVVTLPGLPPQATLVHPDDLGPAADVMAGFSGPVRVPYAIVAPARGADAFEVLTTQNLQAQSFALIVLSVPAVALVAATFANHEVRARRQQSAILASLGGARQAYAILVTRVALAVAGGAGLATLIGFSLYSWGPTILHPDDAPRLGLALAIVLPIGISGLTGATVAWVTHRRMDILRSGGPQGEGDVSVHAPLPLRPLLLGYRPLLVLMVAGLLFAANVGFPLAAAKIPASLAGGNNEWILGANDGLAVGQSVDGRVAAVLRFDSNVKAALAETVSPTLINGVPAIVRGGAWTQLQPYHGLRLESGSSPDDGTIVLGERLAGRLQATVGDQVVIQGADRADVVLLRVSGLVTGSGLLLDEAFSSAGTGERLANLAAGQATLVRVRPDSSAALNALQRAEADVQVTSLRLEPLFPQESTVASAVAHLANLGSQAGSRTLVLRVNGQALATVDSHLDGHQETDVVIPFLVPAGTLDVQVNPQTTSQAAPNSLRWKAPTAIEAGQLFQATLLGDDTAGIEVAMYGSMVEAANANPLQTGITDADGNVTFTAPATRNAVLATRAGTTAAISIPVIHPGGAFVTEAIWTEPATLRIAEPMQLFARVRNDGLVTHAQELAAKVDGAEFTRRSLTLDPGEATTLQITLFVEHPISNITVGDRTVEVARPGDFVASAAKPLPPAQQVQTQLADRALGDARAVLAGLAGSAVLSTLAIVALSTRRTLAGRRHVTQLMHVLGWDEARRRQRAAAEGAALGAIGALVALLPAKLLFLAIGAWGPAVFAHSLPDPVGILFAIQTTTAFAGVCSLAAYFASRSDLGSVTP